MRCCTIIAAPSKITIVELLGFPLKLIMIIFFLNKLAPYPAFIVNDINVLLWSSLIFVNAAKAGDGRLLGSGLILPKITVADASPGQVLLSANRMKDRQDAPSASSRTFPATDRGTLKTNLTIKFPQATA